jgi:predicted ATPase
MGIWSPVFRYLLVDAYLAVDRPREALSSVNDIIDRVIETGEREFESVLLVARGDALRALAPSDEAEAECSYRKAIEIACAQSAKSWELRAATRLARLWHRQGKTAEARDLVAPVYAWFTEGFDTADLKEAKALLDQLG